MGKRKAVPEALHQELSEYTSLLRALRTTDTLDLASQLTKPPDSLASNPLKGKGKGKSRAKQDQDNWTRWPLLKGDFAAPEFTFEDEVKALAAEALLNEQREHWPTPPLNAEEEEEAEELPKSSLEALTLASSTHLTHILGALAVHIPPTEKSMQNRIKPIGWRGVLDILAVSGFADPKTIQDVEHRMQSIYPASSDHGHTVPRAQSALSARYALADFLDAHELSFLELQEPVVLKKLRRGQKSRSAAEVEIDDDEQQQQGGS